MENGVDVAVTGPSTWYKVRQRFAPSHASLSSFRFCALGQARDPARAPATWFGIEFKFANCL